MIETYKILAGKYDKHGVIDRAHARSVSSEFVILTVRMRTVESRKSVNDRASAHGQI